MQIFTFADLPPVSPASRHVTLPSGTRCHVLCWPAPATATAEPCLLLHGFDNNAHIWDALAAGLSQKMPVYALDFRGHGDSDWAAPGSYQYDQLLDDVEHIRRALDLSRFHLIAHSLGARVAILYAARHPAAIASLVISDTGPRVNAAGVNKMRNDTFTQPRSFVSPEAYHDYLAMIYRLADTGALAHLVRHGLARESDGGWRPKTDPEYARAIWKPPGASASGTNESLWQALAAITAPTLLLRASGSAILQQDTAEEMLATLRNGRLVNIPQAGHAVMVDNPRDFNRAVIEFLLEGLR